MSDPDYPTFYRACATFRLRLADPEPLAREEREALVAMLDAFEDMMVGARGLVERIQVISDSLPPQST